MFDLILAVLATFGTSALITNYGGPIGIFIKLRSKTNVLQCTVCLSVWVAIPISIVSGISLIEYFATLGCVILLERLT